MKSRDGADAKPRYYFVLCVAGQWQEHFAEVRHPNRPLFFEAFSSLGGAAFSALR
jgi:hypothetical protein